MPKPTLHLIGNDTSAPRQIVQWCLQQWPHALPEGLVFCVPSAQAMRRLRDTLVRAYSAFQGVHFTQPAGLTNYFAHAPSETVATATEQLCVWDRVFDWLAQADSDHLVSQWLFPGKKEWLTRPAARYTVAQRFIKLRATLAEACLDFGGVAAHPQTKLLDARERGRWAALDALETQYREQLAELNLIDPADVQLEIFRHPQALPLEDQTDWRLIVACVPDMMPALHTLLEAAPRCDILVQANPSEVERYTAYGIPDPHYWLQAPLSFSDTSITLAETPADEAACIEHFVARTGTVNPYQICLGVLNRDIMPTLTGTFATHGIRIFEPSPIPLLRQPTTRILQNLFKLARTPHVGLLLPLLTIPEATASVGSNYATLRRALIELIDRHRPATLESALGFAKPDFPEKLFLKQVLRWLETLRQNPCQGARAILIELFGNQTVNPVKDALLFATFEALQQLFSEIEEVRVPNVTPSEALLMTRLSQTALHPIRGTSDTSYEGRFEILWSDAKQFAVAGLNEGIFPDTTFEDTFLPNNFRRKLGLRSDINRISRDAYILETLAGRVDPAYLKLTCSRMNANGDWMKPSRLFFRCDHASRAARAKRFFLDPAAQTLSEGALSSLALASSPAEWLQTHPHTLTRLSPSAIARFLTAPVYYWMEKVLKLVETVPLEDGIQPNVFGTLIHEALEALPETEATTVDALEQMLKATFDQKFYALYGTDPNVELLALRHAAHKRLKQAAAVEAQLRQEGWKTVYRESDTRKGAWEVPVNVEGQWVTLYGQIDRVDYNASTQTWRVIDYKTGANGTTPNKAHYDLKEKLPVWKNFQLPIYRLMTRHAVALAPEVPIEMAYFALPAKGECGVFLLKDPTSEAETLEHLKQTLLKMLTLSEKTLLENHEAVKNPLLKHLLSSYLHSNETHA